MKKNKAEMIRVNQAGEYGARRIYEGQLAALKGSAAADTIQHMYEQELLHLEYFNKEIVKRRVRPTVMHPVWHVAGYALGFISGKLGTKAAMACTAAVEEVIDQHYQDQIDQLDDTEQELKASIEKFRTEELEHRDIGLAQSDSDPISQLYKQLIRMCAKAAIGISKKI